MMTEYGRCPAFGYECEYVAKVEAQAAEIERLEKEVERRTYDGIHTCHDECQRVPCRQRREIERLREIIKPLTATAGCCDACECLMKLSRNARAALGEMEWRS